MTQLSEGGTVGNREGDYTGLSTSDETMARGIAHELRNALFAIGMSVDAFELAGDQRDAGVEKFIASVRRQMQTLEQLVADLAILSDHAPLELSPARFDTVLELAAMLFERGNSESVRGLQEDPPGVRLRRVEADPVRLTAAIQSFLSYARARGNALPSVTLAEADGGATIECAIEDSGPLLSAEDVAHIFDPFHPRRRGGAELRLTAARRIIQKHGGAVRAEPGSPTGLRLIVRLPLMPEGRGTRV